MGDRRNFIRGFGLFGAVMAGAATAKVVIEEKKPEVEDISHLAPDDPSSLVLCGQRKKTEPNPYIISNAEFDIISNAEFENKVQLSVGKDDRLWIKVNDKWMRVAVE